jgi:hypothetical protein
MSVCETTVCPMDGAVEHTGTVLAACLRVNAMASLYAEISVTGFRTLMDGS